ncbi:MAG: hypothetical protein ACI8XM_002293 [Haloarculaceae archaeon]|jgi:hypothetical protein
MVDAKGQTTLDFAIGISIFLSVLLFVFAFVPGLLQPFTGGNAEDPTLAGRLADKLSQGQLGAPDEPYVLDRHCTVAFFDTGASPPSECRYDGGTVQNRLSIKDRTNVNVSLQGNVTAGNSQSETLCWDRGDHELKEVSTTGCDVLATGDPPPASSGTTVTARRVVSVHDEVVTMKVVVW